MKRLSLVALVLVSLFALALNPIVGGLALFGVALLNANVRSWLRAGALGTQPTGTLNDGNLAFGSQQITLTPPSGSPITLIADNIDYEVSARVITRPNEFGVPTAEVLITEVGTGSATLQVPATTNVPTSGALVALFSTGTTKDSDNVATIAIKVTKVGRKWVQDGETKINVEFRQKLT